MKKTASTATTDPNRAITSERLAQICAAIAADKKAEDIVAIDLRGTSTFTDFFLICSGTSEPHLKAIANELRDRLFKDHDVKPLTIDGIPQSQWIVAHFGDVVVHILGVEKRAYYGLEDLWGDAPRLKLKLKAA